MTAKRRVSVSGLYRSGTMVSFVVLLALFGSSTVVCHDVNGVDDVDAQQYMKREHSLIKPYQGNQGTKGWI